MFSFRVGSGVAVGDEQLMSAPLAPGFRVNSVSVSTDNDDVGYWEFGNRLVRKSLILIFVVKNGSKEKGTETKLESYVRLKCLYFEIRMD